MVDIAVSVVKHFVSFLRINFVCRHSAECHPTPEVTVTGQQVRLLSGVLTTINIMSNLKTTITTMVDFRTPQQKLNAANEERVVNLYLTFRGDPRYKSVSDYRIFETIARDPQVKVNTTAGVRAILVRKGVYSSKR